MLAHNVNCPHEMAGKLAPEFKELMFNFYNFFRQVHH